MATPLVSIVTPSYNQAEFLEETIRSVLDQDYPNLEYLVVDGGSTDGSVAIIERYADRLAWWTSEPDSGQPEAINKGFARARGELVGWINSDDTLLPGSVSAAVEALERRPGAVLVHGGVVEIDEAGRELAYTPPIETDVVEMFRTGTFMVGQQGALFTREVLERVGFMNEEDQILFDAELLFLIKLAGPVVTIDRPLATYRLHGESKTVSRPTRRAHAYAGFYDQLLARAKIPDELRQHEAEGRSYAYKYAGMLFYAGFDHARARRYLLRSLRLNPRGFEGPYLRVLAKAFLPGWLHRLVAS
jgi:glycosyltransferase involved in cell wall biosynthesis